MMRPCLRLALGLLGAAALLLITRSATLDATQRAARPNFIVFLTDDQGYGDLSSFGHPTLRTPNIDRLAAEGMRLTSFYAANSCTPSRAQLLTGRYAFRSGLLVPYGPGSPIGVAADETTLGDALKRQGYRTGMLGKWHLGDFDTRPEFNPLRHGFDVFLGIPYSHDYRRPFVQDAVRGVPLYRGFDQVERPVEANTLTKRLTDEALRFIRGSQGQPFFLYLAYNMPHLPVGASSSFNGRSAAGRYGDAVEEIDWSVGQVMAELQARGLDRDTMTVFFSDNGPWSNAPARSFQEGQTLWDTGSAGPLRGAKGTTWEGGVRVPAAIRWPGTIPSAQVSSAIVSELDVCPTFVSLAGGQIARDHPSDGYDLMPFLTHHQPSPRHGLYYIVNRDLQAVREGEWKLRIADGTDPTLFDLDRDPGERLDVASANPRVVAHLRELLDRFRPQVSAPAPAGK